MSLTCFLQSDSAAGGRGNSGQGLCPPPRCYPCRDSLAGHPLASREAHQRPEWGVAGPWPGGLAECRLLLDCHEQVCPWRRQSSGEEWERANHGVQPSETTWRPTAVLLLPGHQVPLWMLGIKSWGIQEDWMPAGGGVHRTTPRKGAWLGVKSAVLTAWVPG